MDSAPSSKSMTVVRLFDVRPDMRTSEYALLGGIAFRAALSEKSDVPLLKYAAALLIVTAPLSRNIVTYYHSFVNSCARIIRKKSAPFGKYFWLLCQVECLENL